MHIQIPATHDEAMKQSAFTLFELLVVITILMALASMLMPVIGMMRAAADRTACASRLRQIGVAQSAWRSDHHGEFLPGDPYMKLYGAALIWPAFLPGSTLFSLKDDQDLPYQAWYEKGGVPLWFEASASGYTYDEATARTYPDGGRILTSYQYRAALPNCPFPWVIRRNTLQNPSETMFTGDLATRRRSGDRDDFPTSPHRSGEQYFSNMLFVDGRVTLFRDSELVPYYYNTLDFLAPPAGAP